jgi:predicted AAA+ superfamily ATPase
MKGVILEQREDAEEIFKRGKIERELLPKFLSHLNVLAILGIRRCGKSILSWQVF